MTHPSPQRKEAEQLDLFGPLDAGQAQRMIDALPAKERVRVDEAATVLDCSPRHIFNLIYEGHLEAINIARLAQSRPLYRIWTRSLRAFIDKRKEGAQP